MDKTEEELTCRICLDSDVRLALIAPCACSGSSRWVHRECLDRWRATREDVAFSKCTECLTPYVLFSPVPRNSPKAICKRYFRFLCNLCFDLYKPILIGMLVITILSLIVCTFDFKSHYLIDHAHFERYPKTFYFLCGMLVALSIVGMVFMYFWANGDTANTMPNDCCTACRDCCYCCCSSNRVGPIYIGDPCLGCDCCNTCACAECCAGATVGEECLAILAVVVVVLAVIGLLVSVFAGAVYANRSIQRHIHIVSKKTMTKDLVVKDLAPGAIELPSFSLENDFSPAGQYDDIETGFLMTDTTMSIRRND